LYFYRESPLAEFLEGKESGKVQRLVEVSLVKKQSAPLVLKAMRSTKEVAYLSTRNKAIEDLYSHKVVTGSEYQDYQDEEVTKREDE
jgi:hypothetical protein